MNETYDEVFRLRDDAEQRAKSAEAAVARLQGDKARMERAWQRYGTPDTAPLAAENARLRGIEMAARELIECYPAWQRINHPPIAEKAAALKAALAAPPTRGEVVRDDG